MISQNKKEILLSIIVSIYNAGESLNRCLESIQKRNNSIKTYYV